VQRIRACASLADGVELVVADPKRALEDLAAHRLVHSYPQGERRDTLWMLGGWTRTRLERIGGSEPGISGHAGNDAEPANPVAPPSLLFKRFCGFRGARSVNESQNIPRVAPRVPEEAAAGLGVSPDYFDQHIRPELRLLRRGRIVFVFISELERLGASARALW
jgi:hypothetical protein